GIILSAGESTRMGAPKALLDLGGRSFLQRVVAAMIEGGVLRVTVVVGGRHEARLREFLAAEEATSTTPIRIVTNPAPEGGPISSLRCGLAHSVGESAIVHPVDIPAVTAADIAALIKTANEDRSNAHAVITSVGRRRAHPVWLSQQGCKGVLALPATATLRDYLHQADVRIQYVERSNELLRQDVDTPAAYADFTDLWRRRNDAK
ncbi:MAG: nucleotidyltransferase family protein, partial [Planctomycetota bacterium]